MIRLENIMYKYKNSSSVLFDNLSFSINEEEIVAIVGQNGSGKSTIGKLLSGIIKPQKGKIFIDDIDTSKKKNEKEIRNKIDIVFQNPENQIIFNHIYDELSFSFPDLSKPEIENRINLALAQVGMSELKNYDLYALSLGQKQRIMIAEVLAKNKKYIILDEPTSMIDSLGKEKIYEIIQNLKKQGFTIICITNLADEILLADRTLILHQGKIVTEISKKDLVTKSHVLKDFGIVEPTLLKILSQLQENGIKLNPKDFSIDEFVYLLKGELEK